jgi:calcineurin-like phosphoesterase family protein
MARECFVISDTHFGHKNILKFTGANDELIRPFDSVEEMDEHMVERWNSVVGKGDIVYHLGDVFMGSKTSFDKVWSRLKGSKNLVIGNHDDIRYLSSGGYFKEICMWKKMTYFGLLLTHVPVHLSTIQHPGKEPWGVNVHGHIHEKPSPAGPYCCVSVEQVGYVPVSIDQLRVK